ncbi:hypothetical protein ZWY2020_055051 [Hordeum vulgare]|nr:hypothetical protein ZWY2020_055051 [Hordeum vulgare]
MAEGPVALARLREKGMSRERKEEPFPTVECLRAFDCLVVGPGGRRREVLLTSDDNGELTRVMGVELDMSDKPVGLGIRSHQRRRRLADCSPCSLPHALRRPSTPPAHTPPPLRLKEEDGGDVPSGWLPVEKGRVRVSKIRR